MARVLRSRPSAAELADALKERGVLVLPQNESTLRFVTHMDVGEQDVENLRTALAQILRKG
jgi:threonine aldolase